MKSIFTFFLIVAGLSAFCQKPQPVQIQTVENETYVVEYVPIDVAQKNIAAQLAQVDKDLKTVDSQIAQLVKTRDELMKQQAALQYMQSQLNQAAATTPPADAAPQTAPPPEKKKVKKKN